MTFKRLTFLLIAIALFLACALLVTLARAEDEIDWHLSAYATGNFSIKAGYDPGIGVLAQAQARYKWLEGVIAGATAYQHKHDAEFGYTYRACAELRGYVWEGLYLVGAYNFAGYESRFDNGSVWAKSGQNWGAGVGWQDDNLNASVKVYNKEHISENSVWFTRGDFYARIYKCLWAMVEVNYCTFDQMSHGVMERWESWSSLVGLGVRW